MTGLMAPRQKHSARAGKSAKNKPLGSSSDSSNSRRDGRVWIGLDWVDMHESEVTIFGPSFIAFVITWPAARASCRQSALWRANFDRHATKLLRPYPVFLGRAKGVPENVHFGAF